MKGFIEVTENGGKKLIDIKGLWIVEKAEEYATPHQTKIYIVRIFESIVYAEETYDEVIKKIEEAQKEGGVSIQYVPYVPPQEPQIVPLRYVPDVYRTAPMCGYVTSSTSMDAEGNVVAVELAQREDS